MKLINLFDKNPTREIPGVVMVDQHEDQVAGIELEEYVVTKQIQGLIQDFVDQFLASRQGPVSDVCAWVSGFFGSGKSLLVKMLGYILTNREVTLPDGTTVHAADYLAKKYGFSGFTILSKQMKTKAFFYNMLKFDRAKDEDLSRYIYRRVLRDLGFSEIPWVAEIEKTIRDDGLWAKFEQLVKNETGEPWSKTREKIIKIVPTLAKALTKLDPEHYQDSASATKSIEHQKDEFRFTTTTLATRLISEAIQLDQNEGRIVLILDEVGLYLRGESDRLTELNSLAEEIAKLGKGKVWLVATAQEKLEALAPDIVARSEQLGWLRDRFTLKYSLQPENIPPVVEERLLKKNEQSQEYKQLEKLYQQNEGQLETASSIHDAARNQEIFSRFDLASFSRVYPLLPYHIQLMIDIFASLRAKGRKIGQETKLAGRERAVLSVAQSMIGELLNKGAGVGDLVTFDVLYDAIHSVLQVVSSEIHNSIATRMAELRKIDDLQVSSIAKALFLMQQLEEWVPATSENIAAVLYPRLGKDPAKHKTTVEQGLQMLRTRNWVKEEEGRFRFLTEAERSFEQDVTEATLALRSRDLQPRVVETGKQVLKKLRKYNHQKVRLFDVTVYVDEEEVYGGGFHKLKVYTPQWLDSQGEQAGQDLEVKSLGDDESVYWASRIDKSFTDKIRRAVALRKVIEDWERRAKSPQQMAELSSYRKDLASLEDDLPRSLESSLLSGTLFCHGTPRKADPKAGLETTFNDAMKDFTEAHYIQFRDAAVAAAKESEIEAIRKWTGQSLPQIFTDLKLLDSEGNISSSGPVAHAILEQVTKRADGIAGAELAEYFGNKPYGWDESVIRLVVATLQRDSRVQVDPNETKSFTRSSEFRKAKITPGIVLSSAEKADARKRISKLFGEDAGITPERIAEKLASIAKSNIDTIRSLRMQEGYHQLPYCQEMERLESAYQQLVDQSSPSLRMKLFLAPEIADAVEKLAGLPKQLQDFVQKGCMAILAKMWRLVKKLESEAGNLDSEVNEKAVALGQALSSKSLLKDWSSIYSKFQALESRYQKVYAEAHGQAHQAASEAIAQFRRWCQDKGLQPREIKEAETNISSFACPAGPDGRYDSELYVCGACSRNLPTLQSLGPLVREQLNSVKTTVLQHAAKGKPLFEETLIHSQTITKDNELEDFLQKTAEFARYWLSQRKKLRLKLEGQAGSGPSS